jgi:hypothetical protein
MTRLKMKWTAPEVAELKSVTRAAVILAIKRGALKATMRTAGGIKWWEIDGRSVEAWVPQVHRKPAKKGGRK